MKEYVVYKDGDQIDSILALGIGQAVSLLIRRETNIRNYENKDDADLFHIIAKGIISIANSRYEIVPKDSDLSP